MRVKCYWNLHKNVFSVLHKTPKGWRLWKHMSSFTLIDATTKVSEAGRQRVLKEKRKNVHSFVEGYLIADFVVDIAHSEGHRLTYNPYKHEQFYLADEDTYLPITQAKAIQANTQNNKPQLTAYL